MSNSFDGLSGESPLPAHDMLLHADSRRWRRRPRAAAAMVCCLLWAAAGHAGAQGLETGAGTTVGAGDPPYSEMVAAAHPRAARAGARVLAAGGNATDAAIASQLVLNLVEPQSSGIGGGAFLLHYEAATGELRSYDGRETAPAGATPDLFVNPDGGLPEYFEALAGGRSVGAPGLVRMLEKAHRAHGTLPWRDLFEPAIELAEAGFEIGPRLHMLLSRVPTIARFPDAAAYFLDAGGMPKTVGTILRNPAFSDTLRRIADGGADAFHRGDVAQDIVRSVATAPVNPGRLSGADLAGYASKLRPPVCGAYRGYRVCSMGPPSSGGLAVLQILGMLEHFDMAALAPNSASAVHLFAEASRLAYADRDLYIADPDFVSVPVEGLLDPAYLRGRAALIDADSAAADAAPGVPPGAEEHVALLTANPATRADIAAVEAHIEVVTFLPQDLG